LTPSAPRQNGSRPPRPAASTSCWPGSAPPGPCNEGDLDLADAIDFNAALAADAHQQLLLGSTETLDVRRSIAAGNLARNQQAFDLGSAPDDQPRRSQRRQVVLHVHLEDAAVLGAGGLARVHETPGPVSAEQVRVWCGNPDTQVTVQPVLDLAQHLHVGSYQASARLRLQTQLRDLVCAFPFCFRPADACDCEHRVPHADDGPTCSCNLAPACRSHHRAKTTGGWNYAERPRLAREFRAHFEDTTITGHVDPEP
jgi:hypothetical protein